MDPVFLSRLQFAATTLFHFLFVPLTLGLSILVAYNASSSPLTLKIMLMVVLLFIPVVLVYQIWAYHLFSGKVTQEDLNLDEAY